MKKTLIVFTAAFLFAACGSNSTNEKDSGEQATTATETPAPAEAPAADPDIERGLTLVAGSDCFTCHKVSEKLVGPAYEAVAAKYENNAQVIDTLASKIIKGGAGNWGQIPMTPHPDIKPEDARAMAKYVMSLKQ